MVSRRVVRRAGSMMDLTVCGAAAWASLTTRAAGLSARTLSARTRSARTMIEGFVMAGEAVMFFPGVMDDNLGRIAPIIRPTQGVRRVAICRITRAVAVAIRWHHASADTAGN